MTAEPINLRVSVLIARAEACAAGFDRLGKKFSASFTRENILHPLKCGLPAALYEHWVAQLEALLADYQRNNTAHAAREISAAMAALGE